MDRLFVDASSSARFEGSDLQARLVAVGAHSSAVVHCKASEGIEAHASSSGKVRYEGEPQVRSHVSSSGAVRPR